MVSLIPSTVVAHPGLTHMTKHPGGTWSELEGECVLTSALISTKVIFTYGMVYDGGSLIVALFGALRGRRTPNGSLWRTIYHQVRRQDHCHTHRCRSMSLLGYRLDHDRFGFLYHRRCALAFTNPATSSLTHIEPNIQSFLWLDLNGGS